MKTKNISQNLFAISDKEIFFTIIDDALRHCDSVIERRLFSATLSYWR